MACEVERRVKDPEALAGITEAIRRAVAEEHEARVWDVALLREGTLPKTSSGKVQRHACRAGYLAGSLDLAGRGGEPREAGAAG